MRVAWGTQLFVLVCLGGTAAAATLAVREAVSSDAVHASVVERSRAGLTTTTTVEITNDDAVSRCVTVRVVARDRAGTDLAATRQAAVPVPAHGRLRRTFSFDLSERDYTERVTLIRAVVRTIEEERCVQK